MRKTPFNMLKLGVVGCAMLVGMSTEILPMTGSASAETSEQVKAVPIKAPITDVPISAGQSASISIKEEILTSSTENLKTNIKVPQLTGMQDTKYQDQLNDILLSHANKDLANWEKEATEAAAKAKEYGIEYRPYELTIVYSVKSDGSGHPAGVLSLEITTYAATGGTGMPRIDTYNVLNAAHAQRVTLADLLGEDFKDTVNAGVIAKINEQPANYFKDDFKGIGDEQSFYVEKGEAVVVFPKYSIAPGSSGSPEFRFPLAENLTVNPKPAEPAPSASAKLDLQAADTITNADGVTMVPLRKVVEGLGYRVKWNQDTYSAELNKGTQWTSVTAGKDSYLVAKKAPVSLGAAAIIQKDTLFVPIKFITDILKAEVQNGDEGHIQIEQK
ncbi:stalk domain-containing protein [Paenibacillus sp. SI8]|uniref:stalk domain-containing protein n=1 Tax=unclassified Paenibacillus TaxID=185978 RepID=UPI00346560B2